MVELIREKLSVIEQQENCRILLAVESGSRAWGFASPDSDYDVRFIYARPKESYLKLERVRDVICLPTNDDLDISGWDLDKTLKLLHNSNPTVFEWLYSPIVYKTTDFVEQLKPIMLNYFSLKNVLWHYWNMAKSNYLDYLKSDMVKAKKYFYVIRPVLACRWILEKRTPPPMLLSELIESQLPNQLEGVVSNLLELKVNSPEIKTIPKISVLNEYLDKSIIEIKKQIELLPKKTFKGWDELDELFLSALGNG